MDAPEHQSMDELAHMAGGVETEESRERARLWAKHCVELVPKEQRSAAMAVPAMSEKEREEAKNRTREEKDQQIIANTVSAWEELRQAR